MEATFSFETSVEFQRITRHYNFITTSVGISGTWPWSFVAETIGEFRWKNGISDDSTSILWGYIEDCIDKR
jgi:hypothetical protein